MTYKITFYLKHEFEPVLIYGDESLAQSVRKIRLGVRQGDIHTNPVNQPGEKHIFETDSVAYIHVEPLGAPL